MYESKKNLHTLQSSRKVYIEIYRRIKYEDITDLTPAEGRETPYSIQMQIAQVRGTTVEQTMFNAALYEEHALYLL